MSICPGVHGSWEVPPEVEHRARKMLRRYAQTGSPFSSHGWLREIPVAKVAIAISLVDFFTRLHAAFSTET